MAAAALLAAISGGMNVLAERKAVAGSSQGILQASTGIVSALLCTVYSGPECTVYTVVL